MSASFSQTTRALDADRSRGSATTLLVALAFAAAWTTWFFRAPITVHEVTENGRVEAEEAAHAVDSPVGARVAGVHASLGQEVSEGEVLVDLDAEGERRQRAEAQARLAAVLPQIYALKRQVDATSQALVDDQRATVSALAQAEAMRQEEEAQATQAADEARRSRTLFERRAVSELDMTRARADDERKRAALEASSLELSRLERDQRTRDSQGRGRIEDLRREVAALEGEGARAAASVESLDHEIDRRTVRAPIAGRVGELGTFRAGSFVREGERLAVVVPHGRLRAVGEFAPEGALGRIRPLGTARLRLHGFSWMQYGTVPAVVTRVASELRDGTVRVELELHPDPASLIPLEHGLPASIEVDVERTTPFRLAMRAAGTWLRQSTRGAAR